MVNSFYTTNPYMMRAFGAKTDAAANFLGGLLGVGGNNQQQGPPDPNNKQYLAGTISDKDIKNITDTATTQAKSQLLNDPAIDKKVTDLTQNAVHSGINQARDDIFGGIFGFMNSLGPYTPYILVGAGLIAVIMLMW